MQVTQLRRLDGPVARPGELCEFKRSVNDGFIEFSWIHARDRQMPAET
jgi:hypothetical protein